MTEIPLESKKWPKKLQNLKNYQNSYETYKMTKIFLKPLIYQKYPWKIQNTPNLYFGHFRCFKCILVTVLGFGGCFDHFLGFGGISVIFLGFGGISVIF